ncbi:MAG: hypothetical protein J6589_09685, partial [Snodgrassella sp.]|uniref:hypothetical protein n=1 Tax=Snodgrassella sp. TaxID=2815304 RepID=UPI00258471C2
FNNLLKNFIFLKYIIPICTILIGIFIANSLIRRYRSKKSIFSEFYYYIDTLVLQRISNTIFGIFVLIFSSISSLLIWLVLNPHHADCNFATFLQLFKYAIAFFICFINFHCLLKFLLKIAKTKNESNHPNHPRQSANA